MTCCSSIASSSADWVLGDDRLISSAITMFAKIAPCLNSNSRSSGLKTLTPVTSPGSRSGVNWMRRTVAWTDAASARASIVLPTPGTSSMSRCPSASRHTSEDRTASGLPSMTLPDRGEDVVGRAGESARVQPRLGRRRHPLVRGLRSLRSPSAFAISGSARRGHRRPFLDPNLATAAVGLGDGCTRATRCIRRTIRVRVAASSDMRDERASCAHER